MTSLIRRIERRISRTPILRRLVDRWPRESLGSHQQTLIRLLALSHEHNVSPAILIDSLAQQCRFTHRRRLRKLAQRISSGTSVPDSLEQTPGVVRDDVVLSLQIARQTGTLRETYAALSRSSDASEKARLVPNHRRFTGTYLIASLIVIALVISFLCVFILPTIRQIYEEFGMVLPESMKSVIRTTRNFMNYWYVGAIAVVVIAWCATSPWIRRWWRQTVLAGFLRSNSTLHSPSILRCLAVTTRSGRPVVATLSALGKYHFDGRTRQQLLLARNEIEQGEDVWESLTQSRLLSRRESSGLARLDDAEIRSWAMVRLADQRDEARAARRHWIIETLHPLAVLLLGAVVAWIGLAMVQSLYSLAIPLAGSSY